MYAAYKSLKCMLRTVDIKSLHTSVEMASFCELKKRN